MQKQQSITSDTDHLDNLSNQNNSAVHCLILLEFDNLVQYETGEGHVSKGEPEVEISRQRRNIFALNLSIIIKTVKVANQSNYNIIQ